MNNEIDPNEISGFILYIATRAGELIMSYFGGDYRIAPKNVDKSNIDIVTEADFKSEEFILEAIAKEFPGHDVITEETRTKETGSRWKWFVDPLDGTVNFAHGFPVFCVSVGLMKEDQLMAGVIHDPFRNETFSAFRGGGAFLDGTVIQVSKTNRLESSLVATGFPYDRATSPDNNLAEFCRVMPRVQGVRRAGSAALDLAYVACGRLDGFWELKLNPWDMAAGMLLVQEAGGAISDTSGKRVGVYTPSVLATNGLIHDLLVGLIEPKA